MFKKLLVPLDRSELAEKALPYALSLAKTYQAELILLVIVQKIPPYILSSEMGMHSYALIEKDMEREVEVAQAYLSDLSAKYSDADFKLRTMTLTEQSVPEGIVEVANSEDVDVIIKTTHGRSGPSRWVFGNVATKVLQQAPCPVFLVRVS